MVKGGMEGNQNFRGWGFKKFEVVIKKRFFEGWGNKNWLWGQKKIWSGESKKIEGGGEFKFDLIGL